MPGDPDTRVTPLAGRSLGVAGSALVVRPQGADPEGSLRERRERTLSDVPRPHPRRWWFPAAAALASLAFPGVAALPTPSSGAPDGHVQVSLDADPAAHRATTEAGSTVVGQTAYAIPAGARVVSPSGSDFASGSVQSPWRTLKHALAAVPSGGTVVLRHGRYHESVSTSKRVTVQAYPHEAVWLDGASSVTGWSRDGEDWRRDGWTYEFDSSASYTRGAGDGTGSWRWVNPAHPMAAHPDQVWLAGRELRQVSSRAAVAPGTFFVDEPGDRLYVGSDPSGVLVEASTLGTAIALRGPDSVLRGIGVRRYATAVPDMGMVISTGAGNRLENVVVSDSATQGLVITGRSTTVSRITATGNGLLGLLGGDSADGLRIRDSRFTGNNTEHFNHSPVSGGVKVTGVRSLHVEASYFGGNDGPGLWMDECVNDADIVHNDVVGNAHHGISFEVSGHALLADNLVAGNAGAGIKVNNSQDVSLWNNTVLGNAGKPLWAAQDPRTPENRHGTRYTDASLSWRIGPLLLHNNVFSSDEAGCLLCIEDYTRRRSGAQIGVSSDGNVLHRGSQATTPWDGLWPAAGAGAIGHRTLASWRAGTGQDRSSLAFLGPPVTLGTGDLRASIATRGPAVARPLPATVAGALHLPTGTRRLGAIF